MKRGNVRCMDCRCNGGDTCPGEPPGRQAEWQQQMDRELGGVRSNRMSAKPPRKPVFVSVRGKRDG